MGQPLSDRLRVRVIGTLGLPLANVWVSFAVTSGSATLADTTALTDAAGVAEVAVTLSESPGPAVVTASVPGATEVTYQLTGMNDPNGVTALPVVGEGGIVGAGLSVPPVQVISPGGIVSIFGTAFAPPGTARQVGPGDLVGGRLPTNMGNVCVEMGTLRAFMLHLYTNQFNVQAPALPLGEPVAVRVIRNCGLPEEIKSGPWEVMVQATSPEFFYLKANADGRNPIAAVKPLSGEYIGPPGSVPGVALVRALPGDMVDLYTTGFGATQPLVPPGDIPAFTAEAKVRPEVTIGGFTVPPANVVYCGVTQWAGVYLLRIIVPAMGHGEHPVTVKFGGVKSPSGGYLTVGP